jgi:hypothetical protein
METGLFEMQADQLREFRQARHIHRDSRKIVYAMFARADAIDADSDRNSLGITPEGPFIVAARISCEGSRHWTLEQGL